MKRTILFFFSLAILMPLCHSQTKIDLKGPKAKNHKIWKDGQAESSAVFTLNSTGDYPTGPKAKNSHRLLKSDRETVGVTANAQKTRLKGPNYKNRQSWQHKKGNTPDQQAREEISSSHPVRGCVKSPYKMNEQG